METMPSLRIDIAELLEVLGRQRGWQEMTQQIIWPPRARPSEYLHVGAQALRWCDERERAFDEAEREDLAERLEDLEAEYESDRAEWDAKRDKLEQTIARLREDLAEALAG